MSSIPLFQHIVDSLLISDENCRFYVASNSRAAHFGILKGECTYVLAEHYKNERKDNYTIMFPNRLFIDEWKPRAMINPLFEEYQTELKSADNEHNRIQLNNILSIVERAEIHLKGEIKERDSGIEQIRSLFKTTKEDNVRRQLLSIIERETDLYHSLENRKRIFDKKKDYINKKEIGIKEALQKQKNT